MISLADRLEISDASVRKTRDGYLVADAKTARTGVQVYSARELGITDRDPAAKVRVYRSPDEVFSADAMASMGYRPMTNDHPGEAVTADNWKRLAIGNAGGDVVRDGDFVRVPLVMMDAAAIRDFQDGKRELSWGYTCEVKLQDGTTPGGETFDAIQTDIRANHIALCNKARGGDKLTFGDHQPEERPVNLKTILVDGLNVQVTEDAERAITKLQGLLADALAAKDTAINAAGDLAGKLAVKDGEVVALTAQLKDAQDPAKLQAAAGARASLVTAAKGILGDSYVFDGKSDAEIRRAAVVAKVGDKAKDMEDGAISGAFAVLAADAGGGDDIRGAVADGLTSAKDSAKLAEDARKDMIANLKGEKKAA